MDNHLLEPLREAARKLDGTIDAVDKALRSIEAKDGSSIDFGVKLSDDSGSLHDVFTRLDGLSTLVSGLSDESSNDDLVPRRWFSALTSQINALVDELDSVRTTLRAVKKDGGVAKVASGTVQIHSINGKQAPDLRPKLLSIDDGVDGALDSAYGMMSVVKRDRFDSIGKFFQRLASEQERLEELRKEITNIRRASRQHGARIDNLAQQAESVSENITASASSAEESTAKIKSGHESISSVLNEITELKTKSRALKTSIDEYQKRFNRFDEELSKRHDEFEEGSTRHQDIMGKLTESEADLDRIHRKSLEVLGWANASGLTEGFAQASSELDGPLCRAQIGSTRP